MNMKLNIVRCL